MSGKTWFIVIAGLLIVGCARQAPQRPSQRMGEAPQVDSVQLALLELNRQMTVAADQQLAQLAQAQDEPYALYEGNVWMTILDRGNEEEGTPAPNEEWRVAMRIYDLNGRLLIDSDGSYRIGKQELPLGVEANIDELHRGGKARMFVPWYTAYGVTGTDAIPPYENVIIEIELK